jgi:hypothetical protein
MFKRALGNKKILVTILAVILVTVGGTLASTSAAVGAPAWAFNGAYAEYKASYATSGTSMSATMKCTISNVDVDAQTCEVSLSYSGLGASVNAMNQTASFAEPPFFIISPNVLATLNSGQVPSNMAGGQISKDVSIDVQAGTFITDKITASGASEWIETKTGLIVKMSGTIPGNSVLGSGQSAQMELASTNILSNGGNGVLSASNLLIYLIIAALVVVALVGGLFLYKKRAGKQTTLNPNLAATTQQSANSSSEAIDKLRRLKAMFDKGLITQQEYDEQKKRLLESI